MYFPDKPELNLSADAVLAFVCLRNESIRLPFFLQYYKDLGVDHFFIIDNQSDDGSAEIALAHENVSVFQYRWAVIKAQQRDDSGLRNWRTITV